MHACGEGRALRPCLDHEFGKSLVYMDFPDPIVGPDEVRVAVKAVGMSEVVKSRAWNEDDSKNRAVFTV